MTEVSDIAARIPGDARIICIAGPVAVGKSTFAQSLADALVATQRGPVDVVSTDGFLLPNSVLMARGLLERKGFPESYDIAALAVFVRAVRANESAIAIPQYSHETFDVTAGRTVDAPHIAIVEGVNALQPEVGALADFSVYLDAGDEAVVGWYVDRFVQLTRTARRTGAGFYTRFAELDDDGVADAARFVWDAINAPNLHQHIRPTRSRATLVVRKDTNHNIVAAHPPS